MEKTGRYVFDAAWQAEHDRLQALETIWDPFTRQNLEATGLAAGWRCIEVGAGAGSIARWLCGRVGAHGSVVATDTDTRFLEAAALPNFEVRRHDVTRDGIEPAVYDLVHARLLLEHLPQHEAALDRMIGALKPGGWLVIEEFDHVSFRPEPQSPPEDRAVWSAFLRAFEHLAAERGLDLAFGRRLPSLLESRGLVDVVCEGRTLIEQGGTPGRGLLRLSLQSLRPALTGTGEIDGETLDALIALLDCPAFRWQSQIMMTARARKR